MSASLRVITRNMSTSSVIKTVTVIGGGLMGSGIAQVAAATGHKVYIVEVNDSLVDKAKTGIKKSLERVAKKIYKDDESKGSKYISDTLARINGTSDLKTAVESTDIVIEAIIENIKIKHELFTKLDQLAPEHTLFASNTSSLSIGEIASVTKRQDRFGGLHFFNPVPMMKLLEVVKTEKLTEESFNRMMAFGAALGKTCITCKDTPGFVVNRLLVPYLSEAVKMVERGDATAKDIDIAMKLGAGHPMGPIELNDYVGLDTTNHIMQGWHEKFPNDPIFKPSTLIKKLVDEGKLGVKSGEGFYSYKKK